VQRTPIVDHNQHTRTDTSASQYIITFLTHQVLFTQEHLDTTQQHNMAASLANTLEWKLLETYA